MVELHPHSWLWTHLLNSLPGIDDVVTFETYSAKAQLWDPALPTHLIDCWQHSHWIPHHHRFLNQKQFIPIFKGNFVLKKWKIPNVVWGSLWEKKSMNILFLPHSFSTTDFLLSMNLNLGYKPMYPVFLCEWQGCALACLLLWSWDLTQLRGWGRNPTHQTVHYLHISIFNFLSPLHRFLVCRLFAQHNLSVPC